ncbi:MAG: PAS domain S-box protein, partial [Roseibium sp.]|uniref:PAS domain-containing sensor histidine kinase n=1 Tax=Roseibium sp. TaxID=1936156 RepID=UPI00262A47B3
ALPEEFAASLQDQQATVANDAEPEEFMESGELSETDLSPETKEPPETEELTGISGTAELKPAEIEDAVKSLQKSFKASETLKSLDLFEENAKQADETQNEAVAAPVADEDASADDDTVIEDDHTETQMDESDDGVLHEETEEEDLIEVSGENTPAGQTAKDVDAPSERAEDDVSADERDFFEETAAFGLKDQAVETSSEDQPDAEAATEADPEPVKTGKVIPLATARPRVVPVDTSSLSRPERQAFRKIAEALGARLEGDLEDFDSPDPEEEAIDDLTPDVPEAGPIDPTLLDRLPIGIAIVHDREVLYANKALLRMLGYKSIAALSRAGGLEALFIDDTEELPDAVGMDGEVDETMKLRLADGGVLSVDAHMHSVPWNDSWGLMISITERPSKQTPLAPLVALPSQVGADVTSELDDARSQIAEMDTILETATDGVLVLDQHGTIVKVNGSAEALFSANRVDMIGAPFTDFLAPESHRAAADYLDGLSRNGVASILNDGREVLGKVPTGGLIPLFMTIGRITSAKEDAKFCAVLRDITQWKTAEEELTQAKRQAENASSQKSDFLAKISHEIRTPLNAIIGFSEVMMEERFGPIGNDRYKDYLKDIRTSGSHIMSLINDLLDLSKIEAGKLDLNFSAVSTNDVINECVALMQPQANRERVIIRASLPESVPDVVADPRSLRQIVLNLLSNAIKYNKSGGQVILSTALESNGEVALRVRDTGTGMTAKQLAAALEPFRQLHTASRGGGTGLGLPLTKALVEANRASFHIDSTPDQGTLVEIIFPTQRVLSE